MAGMKLKRVAKWLISLVAGEVLVWAVGSLLSFGAIVALLKGFGERLPDLLFYVLFVVAFVLAWVPLYWCSSRLVKEMDRRWKATEKELREDAEAREEAQREGDKARGTIDAFWELEPEIMNLPTLHIEDPEAFEERVNVLYRKMGLADPWLQNWGPWTTSKRRVFFGFVHERMGYGRPDPEDGVTTVRAIRKMASTADDS